MAQKDKVLDEFIFLQVQSLKSPYPDITAMVSQNGQQLSPNAVKGQNWTLTDSKTVLLIEKINQYGQPLSKHIGKQIYRGIITGFNEAFVIDSQKRNELIAFDSRNAEIIKPLAVGDDVRKWHINYKNKWLIVPKIGIEVNRYPAIIEHLSKWQSQLKERQDQGEHWWELRSCTYYPEFEKPKIMYPDIAKESRFVFDDSGKYCTNTTYFFPSDDLYLLGVLNSSVMWKYASEKLTVLGDANKGGRLRFFTQFVSELPIPKATTQTRSEIESRVEQILTAKQANPTADVSTLEREIDALVYALYGLTPAEIALVEGRELSEEETSHAETSRKLRASGKLDKLESVAPPLLFTGQPPQGSFSERSKRVQALTKQATPSAIQELVAALADENATIVWTAAAGLRQIGGAQVAGVLQVFITQTEDAAAKAEAEKILNQLQAV